MRFDCLGHRTLEALLCQRPMVVAYRVAPLTYRILKRLVVVLISHCPICYRLVVCLVPELIRDAATPKRWPLLCCRCWKMARARLPVRFPLFIAACAWMPLDASGEAVLALIAGPVMQLRPGFHPWLKSWSQGLMK